MNWTESIDAYCERVDPSFWAEPMNALTNVAFLVAALIAWCRAGDLPTGRVLAAILAVIGIGSFLFHTFATPWAALADVLPIVVFVFVYIYAANRDFWGLRRIPALGLTALGVPVLAVGAGLFAALPFFDISAGYWPIAMLIFGYAAALASRCPATARGLALGATIVSVSITLRSLDEPLCDAIPVGTHFWWHLLNALMLAWMIEVWRRHHLEAGPAGR